MPLGINFGGASTGFDVWQGIAAGNQAPSFNTLGEANNLFGQVLQAGQFGLSVFEAVTGRNVPPAAVVPVNPAPSSSVVPIPASVTRVNTAQFAPQANLMMRMPGGMAGGAVAVARGGVAIILRKIKANTGLRITTKKIVSAIREFGPSAVASWAGVTMEELMVIWDRGSRRVKRRFTKRDRSRGRSYIRMLARNVQELKDLGCGPATRKRRKY